MTTASKRKKSAESVCAYHRHSNNYNHAGCLPCGTCAWCQEDARALERWKKLAQIADDNATKPASTDVKESQ